MNILNKAALQSLKQNRTRTIVTIVGVVLSAALITAAVTFGLSLLQYAAEGAARKYGGWHVAFSDVDPAFARERSLDKDVAAVTTLENVGYAALDGGQNPDKPYLYVTAFDDEAFAALPLTLLSGREPKNGDEILIPTHLAANGGVDLTAGDTLSLAVGQRKSGSRTLGQHDPYVAGETFAPTEEKTYTVVGVYARPAFEAYAAPGYTAITKADGRTEAESLTLFLTLKDPRQARAYADGAADGRAVFFNNNVLRFLGLSNDGNDNLFNALLYSIGGVVIAIIMVGSIFLIYNAFSISLNERA